MGILLISIYGTFLNTKIQFSIVVIVCISILFTEICIAKIIVFFVSKPFQRPKAGKVYLKINLYSLANLNWLKSQPQRLLEDGDI